MRNDVRRLMLAEGIGTSWVLHAEDGVGTSETNAYPDKKAANKAKGAIVKLLKQAGIDSSETYKNTSVTGMGGWTTGWKLTANEPVPGRAYVRIEFRSGMGGDSVKTAARLREKVAQALAGKFAIVKGKSGSEYVVPVGEAK